MARRAVSSFVYSSFLVVGFLSMSKPAGKCVWCGRTGLTKGHVWADWLDRLMNFPENHGHFQTRDAFSRTDEFAPIPQTQTQKQGSALSRKPRNTCGACNSGWMSRIENAVTPIAIPLILGKPCLIDTIGRWQLASVLCLISMRVAFLTKSPFVLPVEDREWMMEKAEPPPHWKIWITRIVEPPLDEHWTLFSAVALPPSHKVSSDIRILNARPLSSANFARTS